MEEEEEPESVVTIGSDFPIFSSQTQSNQSANCLPIRRLIRRQRTRKFHHQHRFHPGKGISKENGSTGSPGNVGIRSLSPRSILSSLGMPALNIGAHSRAVTTLTFPLRAIRRRVLGEAIIGKLSSHQPRHSLNDNFNESGENENSADQRKASKSLEVDSDTSNGTDIDEVDEFS